jgi:hypothetical protein
MRTVRRVRSKYVPAFLAAMVLSGCGDDSNNPAKPPPSPPAMYMDRSSPQNVLHNLEIAYPQRDSTEYKALYDSSYVGTSEDLNDPPGTIPFSFTYSDEVGHVAALARTPTISSVTFELGPEISWGRLESSDPSHPEWATIQIAGSSIDIQVTDGISTIQASGSNEFFEFTFKPTTPEYFSPTDTLWKIVRWRESRAAGP